MKELSVKTGARQEMVDISGQLQGLVRDNGWRNGALLVFCPHTTAAVTVNEGADPSVARDINAALCSLVPHKGDYQHLEGNSDAHVKASLVGPDQMLIVNDNQLALGTWQKVFFCEFDGPRSRRLWVRWLPGQ
ncbi:MAG: YjbQ family protein [Desulfovibrionaceae bacterium]|nr:YjbQ family protein [Desulfovibrionaceae bacterium]